MNSSSLGFEFALLERMSDSYRNSILHQIGFAKSEFDRIRSLCPLKYPELLNIKLQEGIDLLGDEVRDSHVISDAPDSFSGSTAHYFLLSLWPHMYWVINQLPDGQTWGNGFQNQFDIHFKNFEPDTVRPGVWTRRVIENYADEHKLFDGWDESVFIRFQFGDANYEGHFVFELLQEWKKV